MLLNIILSLIAISFHFLSSKKYNYSVIFYRNKDSYSINWWLYFSFCVAIFVSITKDGNITYSNMAISSIVADIAMIIFYKIKK